MKINKKQILILIGSGITFFLITMPFRKMFQLMAVTEVRPAGALPPVFGLLFGVPGALGCAVGNFLADMLSGYSIVLCLFGVVVQFLYGIFPRLIWRKLHGSKIFHLNNMQNILKYIVIICLDSFFVALALGILTQVFLFSRLISASTVFIFFNNVVFCLILGIPLYVVLDLLITKDKRKVFSLNVRFVLMFFMLSAISAILLGSMYYWQGAHYMKDFMQLWNRVYIFVVMDFFVLCGISLIFLWFLERNITIPIEHLSDMAKSYGNVPSTEHLDSKKYIEKCKQLSSLSGEPGNLAFAFGKLLQDIEQYVTEVKHVTKEKEKIKAELDLASKVQMDMLPEAQEIFSKQEQVMLSAKMTAAKGVGGDFYDFFLIDDDHLAFMVSDVSGKGIPAALFMVMAKILLMSHTKKTDNPAQAFADTNNSLCDNNKDEMFVTSWMGVLTLSSGELTYVNAGHNPPLLKRKDKDYEYLTEHSGFVLAGMKDLSYQPYTIRLEPGEQLFIYSDGVTEAHNLEGGLYGEQRLQECLNRKDESPKKQIEIVWNEVKEFQGKAEQFDDITMLSLQYLGDGYEKYTSNSDIELTEDIEAFVESVLLKYKITEEVRLLFQIVVDEWYSNICRYGKASVVTVGCRVLDDKIVIYFEDDGIQFNPLNQEDPDISGDIERRKVGGLGIYMIKQMMDKVSYKYMEQRNRLTLQKIL